MSDLFAALALVIVLEGLVYAAFPEQMKRALMSLLGTPNAKLRVVALTFAGAGLVALYMIRG